MTNRQMATKMHHYYFLQQFANNSSHRLVVRLKLKATNKLQKNTHTQPLEAMTKFLADNQYIYLYFVQPLVTPTRCQTNFDQGGSDEKKHNKVHNLASSLASCQQTHDMLRRNH